MTDGETVFDVTDAEFERKVVDASADGPVVVDFWAPWCAPCHALAPALENAVRSMDGRVRLAKVNVDENRTSAMKYGVRGIPAVKIFRDRQVVSEFAGARPESEIQQLLKAITPTEADRIANDAIKTMRAGDIRGGYAAFKRALEIQSDNPVALHGLARLELEAQRPEKVRPYVERLRAAQGETKEVQAFEAWLGFADECRSAGGLERARERMGADENDLDARLAEAQCLAAACKWREALERFLEIVGRDKHFREDAAKNAMVAVFNLVGQKSELANEFRPKLAQALY